MKLPRLASIAAVVVSLLLWSGCGDTFRPVATPVLPPSPNPQLRTFALVLNQNSTSAGAVAEIDVSGDTSFWNQVIGVTPVHAGILGLQIFAANQLADSVSTFGIGIVQPTSTALLLPVGSKPTFVLPVATATTGAAGIITAAVAALGGGTGYQVGDQLTITQSGASGGVVQVIAINTADGSITGIAVISQGSGYTPASALSTTGGHGTGALIDVTAVGGVGVVYVANFGNNTVSVIDPLQVPPAVSATPISLTGTGPMAMANSGTTLYVVNRTSNNVSVIPTTGDTANTELSTKINVGTTPVAAVTNSVTGLVYVYNAGDGTISIIDPATNNPAPPTVAATKLAASSPCLAPVPGAPCAPLAFDAHSQRLYLADGADKVTIFDASQNPPVPLAQIAGLTNPVMVAPLPNGSRAYVVSAGATPASNCGASAGTGQVSVINTTNNQVTKCIKVGDKPVAIAASSDNSKVFVPHQGQGINSSGDFKLPIGTTDIVTATDSVVNELDAPPLDPTCVDSATKTCDRMAPVFVLTSR